jgi:hypothetical protein
VRAFDAAEDDPISAHSWKTSAPRDEYRGAQSPSGLPYAVFKRRFGANLYETLLGEEASQ